MIYVIVFLMLVFFIAPFSLFIHEMGHLIGATIKNASAIRLTVGVGKPFWRGKIKNVDIIIHFIYMVGSLTASVREIPFNHNEKIFITLMGPIFSGIFALLLFIVHYVFVPSSIILLAFYFNLWLFVMNLVPFRVGKKYSDGYIIWELLRMDKVSNHEK